MTRCSVEGLQMTTSNTLTEIQQCDFLHMYKLVLFCQTTALRNYSSDGSVPDFINIF